MQNNHSTFIKIRLLFLGFKSITLILCLFALSACSVSPLEVNSELKASDFSQYSSVKIDTVNKASHPMIQKLSKAMANELQAKGYSLSEQPDLIVVYRVQSVSGKRFELEEIPAKGRVYQRPLLEAVVEAKVLVNAFDPKTEEVVWKASTTRDITHVKQEDIDDERIAKRISEILETFPSR